MNGFEDLIRVDGPVPEGCHATAPSDAPPGPANGAPASAPILDFLRELQAVVDAQRAGPSRDTE